MLRNAGTMPRARTWTRRMLFLVVAVLVAQAIAGHRLLAAQVERGRIERLKTVASFDALATDAIAGATGAVTAAIRASGASEADPPEPGGWAERLAPHLEGIPAWWIVRPIPGGSGPPVLDVAIARGDGTCTDSVRGHIDRSAGPSRALAIACRDHAWMIRAWPIGRLHPHVLVVGVPLDLEFAELMSAKLGSDVVVQVDGHPLASTLERPDGSRAYPTALQRVALGEVTAVDIAGSEPYPGPDRSLASLARRLADPSRTRWYAAAHPIGPERRVAIVTLVPAADTDADFIAATTVLILIGSGLLIVAGAVVRRANRRLALATDGLLQSSRAVAAGATYEPVQVPRGHDLHDLCDAHNEMLSELERWSLERSDLARQAGKNEIAIGVLHNVGNALTSVSAGLELAVERLDQVPVHRLAQLADLLDSPELQGAGLGETDKGRLLPRFVRELARSFAGHHDALREEIASARKASDHASAIVTAQQRHARSLELPERCILSELIEDAIHIAGLGSEAGAIVVERDLGPVVSVVDRTRVLQILVNLLTNARDALWDSQCAERNIAIELRNRDEAFYVRVSDNGPGIATAHHEQVFRLGFTTKPKGHGFGLHASWNTASELGGTLRLISSTPAGTCFELELPRRAALAD